MFGIGFKIIWGRVGIGGETEEASLDLRLSLLKMNHG